MKKWTEHTYHNIVLQKTELEANLLLLEINHGSQAQSMQQTAPNSQDLINN